MEIGVFWATAIWSLPYKSSSGVKYQSCLSKVFCIPCYLLCHASGSCWNDKNINCSKILLKSTMHGLSTFQRVNVIEVTLLQDAVTDAPPFFPLLSFIIDKCFFTDIVPLSLDKSKHCKSEMWSNVQCGSWLLSFFEKLKYLNLSLFKQNYSGLNNMITHYEFLLAWILSVLLFHL